MTVSYGEITLVFNRQEKYAQNRQFSQKQDHILKQFSGAYGTSQRMGESFLFLNVILFS